MTFKAITNSQITDAMPRVGDDTPDALRPTIALTHDLLTDLRDNAEDLDARAQALEAVDADTRLDFIESGLKRSKTIAANYAVLLDDAGKYLITDLSSDTVITLDEGLSLSPDLVLEVTVKNPSGYKVTFENTNSVPYTDLDGKGELRAGGVAWLMYDGLNWSLHGDFE